MRWSRITGVSAFAAVALFAFPAPAKALRVAMPNLTTAQKTLQAEVVVAGKVVEIEKELVLAAQFPGNPQKIGYQVANIKLSDSLLGAKGLTLVRVGFQPSANPGVGNPNVPIRRPFGNISLTEGQEGIFFLRKHHEADFYVLVQNAQPLDKKAENFEKEAGQIKNVLKVLSDPTSALKSKEAAERTFAAGVLITKYRTYPQVVKGQPKQEAISADETKLIFGALLEMEWGKFDGNAPFNMQNLWFSLAIQPKDGWKQPKLTGQPSDAQTMQDAIKKWIQTDGKDYRIQRFVAEK